MTSAPPAVLRVNTPPRLALIPNKIVSPGSRVSFTASATDADIPRQSLIYSLEAGAPAGASIDPATGLLSGTPDAAGKVDVAVTVTIDQEVRKLDDGTLGWGNEKVVSTSTERLGSATRRFSIEVGR